MMTWRYSCTLPACSTVHQPIASLLQLRVWHPSHHPTHSVLHHTPCLLVQLHAAACRQQHCQQHLLKSCCSGTAVMRLQWQQR